MYFTLGYSGEMTKEWIDAGGQKGSAHSADEGKVITFKGEQLTGRKVRYVSGSAGDGGELDHYVLRLRMSHNSGLILSVRTPLTLYSLAL